jgi:hypothetical protein
MSKWLIWLLTRTMIPRALGMAIAGLLLTWGLISETPVRREMVNEKGEKVIVEESQKNLWGEAITVLLIGIGSLFIEQKKAVEVKKTQSLIDSLTPPHYEVKKDGLAGPKTRQAIRVATEDKPPEPSQTKG